jgi:hypothetical protein
LTLKRDNETGLITATNVGGLSLAHSYLGDAEGYLSAARLLDEHAGQFSPKFFLLCHAIELVLKAFILAKGGTEKETKKIKHDLIAAWSRAVALGLQQKKMRICPKLLTALQNHTKIARSGTASHGRTLYLARTFLR